ncbi:hypothetical protein HDU83_002170 [Entophlyctis luteolus]|nr:hypothetical protein HDU83_002170 [Entophlyctis luteolus]
MSSFVAAAPDIDALLKGAIEAKSVIADPSGAFYNWTQTESNIIFSARVHPSVVPADITVSCGDTDDALCVSLKGDTLLKGRLYATVKKDGASVLVRPAFLEDLADDLDPRKRRVPKTPNKYFNFLIVRLVKNSTKNVWPLPIQGGIASGTDTDPHSLYLIANALHELNDSGALKLMHAAAEMGSIAAMLKLAAWYEIGREEMPGLPVAKNEKDALLWHRRAGLAGNAEACYILMTAHASGSHHAEKNFTKALEWSSASLQCGFGADADGGCMALEQPRLYQTLLFQTALMMMEGGHGISDPKPEGAVALWSAAAREGHGQSAWNLGIFYLNGFGLESPDVSLGVEFIRIGMKAVKELSLPPQLSGLTDDAIDALVELDAELKAQGSKLDIEKLKVMAAMKQNNKSVAPSESSLGEGKSISATAKKNQRRREKERLKKLEEKVLNVKSADIGGGAFDWNLAAQRSIAVASISIGLYGLWRVFKGSI